MNLIYSSRSSSSHELVWPHNLNIVILLGTLVLIVSSEIFAQELPELFDTIVYKDLDGNEHEEYAFRAPMKGYPDHVMKLYCSNIKLRLYWNIYREELKLDLRKGLYLRRVARFARHAFNDIRHVDSPFEGPKLSHIDEYFDTTDDVDDEANETATVSPSVNLEAPKIRRKSSIMNMLSLSAAKKIISQHNQQEQQQQTQESTTSSQKESDLMSTHKELDQVSQEIIEVNQIKNPTLIEQVRKFVAKYAPKVTMAIYTRVRTMWWLMYPCVFTKFYLWDAALDEFMKLKRSLVMYPEIQLLNLQDVDCLPTKLFMRILQSCKILNPLMNFTFGQLNLNSLTTRDHSDKL